MLKQSFYSHFFTQISTSFKIYDIVLFEKKKVLTFQNGLGCFHRSIISVVMHLFINPVKLVKTKVCTLRQNTILVVQCI